MTDKDEQISEFNRYLTDSENLKKLLRVFPIIATTCILQILKTIPQQLKTLLRLKRKG